MINQDISENPAKHIYLGIGSNLGNRKKNIEQAKFMLIENNVAIIESSGLYESLSWPDQKNPKFLNIVLKVFTSLSSIKLLNLCKEIEISLGRKKSPKNSPRECDIDIIDYKSKIMSGQISLPHPLMHNRNFVLLPLYELNKAWIHPVTKHSIKSLILSLSNSDIRSIKQK